MPLNPVLVPVLLIFALTTTAGYSAEPDPVAVAQASLQDTASETVDETEPVITDLFGHVTEQARELAARDYSPPSEDLPQPLADMKYSQYRSIRFRSDAALWHDEALFEVQLFHPGFLYRHPVRIHQVRDQKVAPIPFDRAAFRYDGSAAELAEVAPPDLGYAGFRVHYPLNRADYDDEVVAFLGASYFRMLGRHHRYGLSARGLAIDTALAGGEEFPAFREFWLVRPAPEDTTLTLYALLDSPSLTGAYRFELQPGAHTVLDVETRLFARQDIAKLGAAPLTSMFLFGENSMRSFDDFRPRVHDSDGLLMHTSAGEWIWRPLSNGRELRVTSLRDGTLRGFGLVQRERAFDRFLDLEARYDRRPSYWVEVGAGDWGTGGVELVEIPTDTEIHDNIVAYWVPEQPFRAGEQRHFRYRLITFGARLDRQSLAQVKRTRIGWGAVPGQDNPPPRSRRQFVVDFSGGELATLDASQPVEAVLSTSSGQLSHQLVQRLPNGDWRTAFRLSPNDSEPADMRLRLELRGQRLSETWSYVWYPENVQ